MEVSYDEMFEGLFRRCSEIGSNINPVKLMICDTVYEFVMQFKAVTGKCLMQMSHVAPICPIREELLFAELLQPHNRDF